MIKWWAVCLVLGAAGLNLTATGSDQPLTLTLKDDLSHTPIITLGPERVCKGFSYYDGAGALQTGTMDCDLPQPCGHDGETGCWATEAFAAAATQDLAAKVLEGHTVAGVAGAVKLPDAAHVRISNGIYGLGGTGTNPSLADCDRDGATGCVTASAYPAAARAGFNGANLQAGVTVAGVTGTVTECTADGQQECIVKGVYRAADATGVDSWDLRAGRSLAGIGGALKTNCRNAINSANFNHDDLATLPDTPDTSGSSNDFWDTSDEGNAATSIPVTGWSNDNFCDSSGWTDVTTTDGGQTYVTCGNSNVCIYKDKISNLQVTGLLAADGNTTDIVTPAAFTWSAAVAICAASTYGGYPAGTWRLPGFKELVALYAHGIESLGSVPLIGPPSTALELWSSTTRATDGSVGRALTLSNGYAPGRVKTTAYKVICVK
jgi:hypothetical protein